MSTFFVNGAAYPLPAGSVMDFLREELGLTSVKNGCAQGVCGTCTVLVDGRAMRACLLDPDTLAGKEMTTCEGLSLREQAVFGYAFAHCGAVQCGFCTPGMVMRAKGLLEVDPNPSRREIKIALRGNLCRCTGYKKIADAIELAAKLLRENLPVPATVFTGQIGTSIHRVDAIAKTLGTAEYTDDIYLPDMLAGSCVRAAYPRAKVLAIDVTAARAVPGVVAVLTADDIPGEQYIGHLKQDWPVLVAVGECTRTLGDALVLIAAETEAALAAAKAAIQITYEPLEGLFTPEAALAEGAPQIHESGNLLKEERLVRGDASAVIAAAAHKVTNTYHLPPTEHAFLEPECAVCVPETDGSFTLYTADQGIYQTRKETAMAMGIEQERLRVVAKYVGGGFGGKEDMTVQPQAALLAQATGRPVKVRLSRDESILVHPKRHAMTITMTTACDADGNLLAMQADILADTGAYASLGGPVLQRACTHAAGPYHFQTIDILGRAVYTNNPPAGAFRGFGVTQSCFAAECNLNQLAELVGLTPWEIRYKNAIRPGETLPNGQIASADTAMVECLEAAKPILDANPKAGIACAMKNSGLGVGVPDVGRVRLVVADGRVHIRSSAACIGQGLGTILLELVCQTAQLSPQQVVWDAPDTSLAPNSGNTTASRQTLFTGEACRRAALLLAEALEAKTLTNLEGESFYAEYEGITDPMGSEKENPVSHIAYGYAVHVVELAEDGTVERVHAIHDVGRALHPQNVEGQIEGGVVMSLGYALTEDFPLKEGKPLAKMGTLGLLRADRCPEVESVLVEKAAQLAGENSSLAYGAKGVGEICSIPTAPAVQLAYYHRDGEFRTKLPLSGTPYSRN